ncbi:MAG: membrane-bound PQQ-dependent dehydrogenase, glucose/quinate/shikimate family, partial [Sphingobium sp.]
LWDYDVSSQPTLYDIPDGHGGRIPALIQPTKRGEIFVLDRRTGTPIAAVQERAVPAGKAVGDRTSPSQPYSVGMPTISGPRLTEAAMWGFSPLDQLWCRIRFRQLRYEGDFTPPGTDASLLYPGVFGGMNWGSASIDETNDYLIVNDIRLPQIMALVPRAEADRDGKKKVLRRFGAGDVKPGHGGFMPQKGTPYAALYFNFMSPLRVPCQAPPYGTLSAINLETKKIVWQVPMGTTRDTGPLGISMHFPMPVGLPTIGGSLVTKAGLIFFAGTQDRYLRAIDSATGREIWKARMPVGAGATPMTYISPRSKRQFVVIAASGSRDSAVTGDHIIAFALPKKDALGGSAH